MIVWILGLSGAGLALSLASAFLRANARRRLVLQRLYGMQDVGSGPPRRGNMTRPAWERVWPPARTRLLLWVAELMAWLPTASGRAKRKRQAMGRAVPEFAARLYCMMELGFGLESAVGIVVLDHPRRDSSLKNEWFRYLQDVRMGATREEGLRSLGSRTQVPELADLVEALLRAGDDGKALRQRCRESLERLTPRSRPALLPWLLGVEVAGIWYLWCLG